MNEARPLAPGGGPLPTGTVVLLFTDIVGSTTRWESHPDAMRSALARHDGLVRAAIANRRGHVFKTVGDAFCAAFSSASDAVAAAVAAQRALCTEDFSAVDGLMVRMAIHAGAVEARDGDYFGPALNRCARLLAVAHGGQIVVSAAAMALAAGDPPAGAGFLDLGQHRLKDLPQPESIHQVAADGLRATFPALQSQDPKMDNLPLRATSFLGRETELSTIRDVVALHRMVTLTGAGGVGKTRLVIEAATSLGDRFRDGVWFVELASLSHPDLVAETTARTFGLAPPLARSADALVATFLEHKNALIVLDNCEHLIGACAQLAERIISTCPQVTVVATSREPLAVGGEYVYRVDPLGTPPAVSQPTSAANAMAYPSVQMFVDRAHAATGTFTLTDANAGTVAAICRRLDGIPLALEIAAPVLRLLTPTELLAALNERFDVLTRGARTALPRQQTLRAAIDWSYDLLSDDEKRLLARLSIFGGRFTMTAAKDVLSDAVLGPRRIAALVAALADKSLLGVELGAAAARYTLLESTREYAGEKQAQSRETGFECRLAAYLIRLFGDAEQEWAVRRTSDWLADYASELGNLRAALDWSFGPGGDTAQGVALFAYTGEFWRELSLQAEFRRRLETVIAHVSDDSAPHVAGRIWLHHAYCGTPGDPLFIGSVLRAVDLAGRATDTVLLGTAHLHASYLLANQDRAAADAHLDAARSLLLPLGRTKHVASLLNALAGRHHDRGESAASRACYGESLDIARALGFERGYAAAAANLIDDKFNAGEIEAAIVEMSELVERCRRERTLGLLGLCLFYFGDYLLAADRHVEASAIAREGIALNRSLARHAPVNACIETAALAASLSGNLPHAARLAGYVKHFYEKINFARGRTQQRAWSRLMAELESRLPAADVQLLMLEGAGWSEDQAIGDALADRPSRG